MADVGDHGWFSVFMVCVVVSVLCFACLFGFVVVLHHSNNISVISWW